MSKIIGEKYDYRMQFDKTLFQKYNGGDGLKFFPIATILYKNLTMGDEINLTLGKIVESMGHTVKYKQSFWRPYKQILKEIIKDYGMQCSVDDIDALKPNTRFTITTTHDCPLFRTTSSYTIFTFTEMSRIVRGCKEHPDIAISSEIAIGFYIYIKGRINNTTGAPAFQSIRRIAETLGISEDSVKRAIVLLRMIDILFTDHYYVVEDNGRVYNTINVYATNPGMLLDKNRCAAVLGRKMYNNKKLVISSDMKAQLDRGEITTGDVVEISGTYAVRAQAERKDVSFVPEMFVDSVKEPDGAPIEEFDDVELSSGNLSEAYDNFKHVSYFSDDPFGVDKQVNGNWADYGGEPTPQTMANFEELQKRYNAERRKHVQEKIEKRREELERSRNSPDAWKYYERRTDDRPHVDTSLNDDTDDDGDSVGDDDLF